MGVKFSTFFFILVIVFSPLFALAKTDNVTIRVAILDSSNMPPKVWTWLEYEKAYLRGLETAKFAAKKEHINIEYKNFFYGNEPLDIIKETPRVEAWNPDIILGPHYSNQFLLLKNQFKNTLVLSSYASDKAIYDMSNNFYSLFPPDSVISQVVANFISIEFHGKNILIINRSDCKACNNVTELFSDAYKKIDPNIKIYQNNFTGELDDVPDPAVLLKGYKAGDVIAAFVVNLYDYTSLIDRLSPLLKSNPVFISSVDNWGAPNNGLPILTDTQANFKAYLVNPLYFDMGSENFRTFNENYLTLYGAYPSEMVSYVTFMTLTSATDALNTCALKNKPGMAMKQKILACYMRKLRQFPNWYRPHVYAIYQLEAGSGELILKKDMMRYFPKKTGIDHDPY